MAQAIPHILNAGLQTVATKQAKEKEELQKQALMDMLRQVQVSEAQAAVKPQITPTVNASNFMTNNPVFGADIDMGRPAVAAQYRDPNQREVAERLFNHPLAKRLKTSELTDMLKTVYGIMPEQISPYQQAQLDAQKISQERLAAGQELAVTKEARLQQMADFNMELGDRKTDIAEKNLEFTQQKIELDTKYRDATDNNTKARIEIERQKLETTIEQNKKRSELIDSQIAENRAQIKKLTSGSIGTTNPDESKIQNMYWNYKLDLIKNPKPKGLGEKELTYDEFKQKMTGSGATATPAVSGKVLVISPSGKQGYIPASQLSEALKQGYKTK